MEEMRSRLLKSLQDGIPMEPEPFRTLAGRLHSSPEGLIEAVRRLKEERIIRQVSPIYDTKMLGYDSALVAFKVDPPRLEQVADVVNTHPGVSHNYERNQDYNLWFTLAVPPDSDFGVEDTVSALAETEGVYDSAVLRSKKTFKIGVKLDVGSSKGAVKEKVSARKEKTYTPLEEDERELIRVTQEDMPLVPRPFSKYADTLGIGEDRVVEKLREFANRGVMRRFAAVLYHRKAGYKANGMVVWKAPAERVEELGPLMASYRAVTHCYERTSTEGWPYNLYTMIHAKTTEELTDLVGRMSSETGLDDLRVVYSVREFKKVRLKYFTDSFRRWEERARGHAPGGVH